MSDNADNNHDSDDAIRVRVPYFAAQQPVRWLAPVEMARGAYGAFFGGLFGKFADNREHQALLRSPVVHCGASTMARATTDLERDPLRWHLANDEDEVDGADDKEFTFDFVSDVGDGFSATFGVARLLARPQIEKHEMDDCEEYTLKRGSMLIHGGDEVYPVGSPLSYRDRTIGPYRAAFASRTPSPDADRPMFAIPGNHDWYDGLSAFLETFAVPTVGAEPAAGHGWRSHQTRSYFAIELPGQWWLWGIDVGLEGKVDHKQLEYFREVRKLVADDDRIILCTATPAWLDRGTDRFSPTQQTSWDATRDEDDWDQLVKFLQSTFADVDPWKYVRLILSGDLHHYARHELDTAGEQLPALVTAGGGGAFLSSTYDSAKSLRLNRGNREGDGPPVRYRRQAEWPSTRRSFAIGLTGLWRLPIRNASMAALLGAIYGSLAVASISGQTRTQSPREILSNMAEMSLYDGALKGLQGVALNFGGVVYGMAVAAIIVAMAFVRRTPIALAVVASTIHVGLHLAAIGITLALGARIATTSNGTGAGALVWIGIALVAVMTVRFLFLGIWDGVWELKQFAAAVPAAGLIGAVSFFGEPGGEATAAFVFTLAALLLGSLFGMAAFTSYLLIAQVLKMNLNELFVGLRHEGYKHFLRIQVHDDGLVVSAIGYQRVARRTMQWHNGEAVISNPRLSRARRWGHRRVDHFEVSR